MVRFRSRISSEICAWPRAFRALGCAAAIAAAQLPSGHALAEASAVAKGAQPDALSGPRLELGALVHAVLARNPAVGAARQRVVASLARIRQADALEDPMLEVGLAPLSVLPSRARLGIEVGVSQTLPWFGKRAAAARVSAAEADASKSEVDALRRELALAAVALHTQYFLLTRSLEIGLSHAELLRGLRASAVTAFGSGRGSAQDALQAELELTHLEHELALLRTRLSVTTAQMNELLHRAPELPLPPPAAPSADSAPPTMAGGDLTVLPEVQAARRRAQASAARAEQAERDGYPDVTLSASYGTMWDMPQHRLMLGLGVTLPFQRGPRTALAEEARAMQAEATADALRLTDMARTRRYVAKKQLEESAHVATLFQTRLLPVALDRIDAARAGFAAGANSFGTVIEAERALRMLELEAVTAESEAALRRAELSLSLGHIPGVGRLQGAR